MTPPTCRQPQRGITLLGLLFVFTIMVTGALISAMNTRQTAEGREAKTRAALQQAKEAVIGYAAAHKTNPGNLSCPEKLSVEGQADTNCNGASNVLGRLPWRSLKLERLTDGSGEPLWYAVSSGFGSSSTITNNSTGNIVIDGSANPVVAVIIAPGPALPGQTRSLPSPANPPRAADYLDLSNSSPGINAFVSSGSSANFNDRIIAITKADLFSAVNKRILAEIRGSLTANGVLQHYHDHGNTFPAGSTQLNTLPFDTGTKTLLTPWFSLTSYSYSGTSAPQLSLGGTTLVIKP